MKKLFVIASIVSAAYLLIVFSDVRSLTTGGTATTTEKVVVSKANLFNTDAGLVDAMAEVIAEEVIIQRASFETRGRYAGGYAYETPLFIVRVTEYAAPTGKGWQIIFEKDGLTASYGVGPEAEGRNHKWE